VATGEVTPVELLDAARERIDRLDPQLHALTYRWFDEARAVAADPALPAGPFRGVPFLLKDLHAHMAGRPLSNGNAALAAASPPSPRSTTLVERHQRAGLVIAGRTNSPELGSVPTTEPVAWGPTRNPWDASRTPGAVASGMVPVAHASDGGGSIRIPASCCGLVGLKPTQGRITVGPFRDESNLGVEHCVSRTVRDTAALLDATHGPGVGDTVLAPAPARPYLDEVGADPGRLRIGLLDHNPQGTTVVDDACAEAARATGTLLESLGHHVETAFPDALSDATVSSQFLALWATGMATGIAGCEASLGRPLTEDEVEPVNWVQATYARTLAATDLASALAASAAFRRRTQQWWADGWDLLLTPTLGEVPVPLGTMANDPANPLHPLARAAAFVPFTPAWNMTGQPAISLPLHRTAEGLPVGIQLVAAYGREDLLVRVAAQLEEASPWAHLHPPIS
jgi:amidase